MTDTDTERARSPQLDSMDEAKLESRATNLFDLRRLIAGLFVLYGVMLIVASFFTSAADDAKSQGVNINLWTGIGMFALGAFFAIWALLRPLHLDPDTGGLKSGRDTATTRSEPAGSREHA